MNIIKLFSISPSQLSSKRSKIQNQTNNIRDSLNRTSIDYITVHSIPVPPSLETLGPWLQCRTETPANASEKRTAVRNRKADCTWAGTFGNRLHEPCTFPPMIFLPFPAKIYIVKRNQLSTSSPHWLRNLDGSEKHIKINFSPLFIFGEIS